MKYELIANAKKFELEFCLAVVLFLLFLICVTPLFLPLTDLPQHLSQLHLLNNYRYDQDLKLNLLAPNNLIYFLMIVLNLVFSKVWVAKLSVYLLMSSWVFSNYLLAKHFKANKYSFLLSCVLLFNLTLYWGFLNFMSGWLFFVLLLIMVDSYIKSEKNKHLLQIGVVSIFLFASHILWFAVGCFVMALYALLNVSQLKKMFLLCIPMFPVGLYSLYWMFGLSKSRRESGFDVGAHWVNNPIERMLPEYLSNSVFGGLTGHIELLMLVVLFFWIFLSGLELYKRKQFPSSAKIVLVAAALLFSIVLFAPNKYLNTIAFAERWVSCVFILLMLSLPKPQLAVRVLPLSVVVIALIFYLDTFRRWYLFDRYELAGLNKAITALPENKRVIGLDYVKYSPLIDGRPYLQIFAYAQFYKGAEINFSFAEHGTGIVVYDKPRKTPWSSGLEWYAERATKEDLLNFDYVLANTDKNVFRDLSKLPFLSLVENQGSWVLFQVDVSEKVELVE